MGSPAAISGDKVTGICPNHLMPGPSGTVPAGPRPFSAPLTMSLASNVLITGKPAAVVGSNGTCTPPHVGLADAWAVSSTQLGTVMSGSNTVLIEGKPAATASSQCTICAVPAQILMATASTVLIG